MSVETLLVSCKCVELLLLVGLLLLWVKLMKGFVVLSDDD